MNLFVIKRNGKKEIIFFNKITTRLSILKDMKPALINVNLDIITKECISKIYNKIPTKKIDELCSEICVSKGTDNYEYMTLGSRIIISNNHKNTKECFLEKLNILSKNNNISDKLISFATTHRDLINETIDYKRDYDFDYFSFKTLEKSYLLKNENGLVVERIQDMIMRVSIGIHYNSVMSAIQTYNCISKKYFIHATPTLYHAGLNKPQLLSCFLGGIHDSIDGIFEGLKRCGQISKWSGGIGLNIHNIRGKNAIIKGTNGVSNGIIPMLRVFNDTARYVNQSGKRLGSFAVYLEPHHSEIEDFLDLKKNHGDENMRCRDLFLGVWISNLFMKKVQNNCDWYLFNNSDLCDVYGEEYENRYNKYVEEKKYNKVVKARDIWLKILQNQIETGTPYILFKDHCNEKSNQKNLGTIKGSNLCTEIIEYHDENEFACCTLGSIGLPTFINNNKFNFNKLGKVVSILTKNLNNIIDLNYYPIRETEVSNSRNRPIGIGVQGLADVYQILDMPFDSDDARKLNQDIFETIYYYALKESNKLSEINGAYSTFKDSPASKGLLQFDLWNKKPHSNKFNWNELKEKIKKNGLRNSLLVAPMPTASTSQILGFNECFEPYTSNMYVRNTLAGNFVCINKNLVNKLNTLGLWSVELKQQIIKDDGSVQNIDIIPQNIKDIYKTAYEISPKELINQSADRGIYICQSQSLNLFISEPTYQDLTKIHFYSWRKGLKTACYYLRTKPKTKVQQFTIEEPVCSMCEG